MQGLCCQSMQPCSKLWRTCLRRLQQGIRPQQTCPGNARWAQHVSVLCALYLRAQEPYPALRQVPVSADHILPIQWLLMLVLLCRQRAALEGVLQGRSGFALSARMLMAPRRL